MSENKQTAVEWLEENMPNISNHIPLGIALELVAKFEQAKEMEKQQIIDAKDCWLEDERDGEQYYNETFNKK
jgi:hypothetical protein